MHRSRSLRGWDFPCPWSQALALIHWALHPLIICGSALTDTTDNLSEMYMCPLQLMLQTFACFSYHQSYTNLQLGGIFPQWPLQVVMTGSEPATSRWESQHSDHVSNPTRFLQRLYLYVCWSLNYQSMQSLTAISVHTTEGKFQMLDDAIIDFYYICGTHVLISVDTVLLP